jgi:hypothetical protein
MESMVVFAPPSRVKSPRLPNGFAPEDSPASPTYSAFLPTGVSDESGLFVLTIAPFTTKNLGRRWLAVPCF